MFSLKRNQIQTEWKTFGSSAPRAISLFVNVTTSISPAEHNVNIRRPVYDWLPWNDNQASRAEKAERKMSWRPEGNTIQRNVNFNIIVKSSALKASENSSLHPLQPTRNMTACLIKDIQDELLCNIAVLIEYLVKMNLNVLLTTLHNIFNSTPRSCCGAFDQIPRSFCLHKEFPQLRWNCKLLQMPIILPVFFTK